MNRLCAFEDGENLLERIDELAYILKSQYTVASVRLIFRHQRELRGFLEGCSKTAEIIPSSTANDTNRAERCTSTPALWSRRSFDPMQKTGRDVSDRILFDCTGLGENPIRNVAKKIQSESSPRLFPFNEKK
jgi:hypothetical protein